jgi:ABC-2 type transport system permease protein
MKRSMNWRAIRAIARKDLKVVFQNKGVSMPIIIVPLVILAFLPAMALLAPMMEEMGGSQLDELTTYLEGMPLSLAAELEGMDDAQKMVYVALTYLLAPMYLILPLMVASVIAADSFAGEKERKTLEALLYTPTTDRELFVAKVLAAWVPAVGVAWGGFVVYGLMTNLASWPVMGRLFFPNAMWLVLAFWVAPAVAGLGLGVTVLVSARSKTFQEAYQLGGVVVLPIILIMVGQLTGLMYLSTGVVFLLGVVIWAIDAALLRFGGRSFKRSEVIAQLA